MSKEKTESKLKELEKKIEECEALKSEYLAGWQRARADFLNYKKEEIEKIKEIIKYANEELILKILPILDNFELAEKKLPEDLKNNKYVKGILQTRNQLQDFLKQQGIEEIKSIGEKFDPNFHEAVEEVKIEGKEADIVVEEVQKGYQIHGKLLRPAKVKITK